MIFAHRIRRLMQQAGLRPSPGLILILVFMLMPGLIPGLTPGGGSAAAQSDLAQKVERLEKQLRAVQRQVFDNDSPYFADGAGDNAGERPPAAGGDRASLLADLSARMDSLEAELQRLTGRVEELQFANRRLAQELERFRRDADLRFQALEAGGTAPGGAGSAAGQSAGRNSDSAAARDAEADAGRGESGADTESASSSVLPEGGPQAQYDHAFGLLRRGAFAEAETALTAFLDRHPKHELAGNAQYWLGESFYVRQMYPRAAQAFLNGFENYGDSAKAPDNLLKLGMTLGALGQADEACDALDELDRRFPEAEARIRDRMAAERARLGCS